MINGRSPRSSEDSSSLLRLQQQQPPLPIEKAAPKRPKDCANVLAGKVACEAEKR